MAGSKRCWGWISACLLGLSACGGDSSGGPADGTETSTSGDASDDQSGPGTSGVDGSDGSSETGSGFDPLPLPDCDPPADSIAPGASVFSVGDGAWSDPATWNTGAVPGEGDDVQIRPCETVTYDVTGGPEIHSILINGRLRFSRTVDTGLDVGLVIISQDADYPMEEAPCSGAHTLEAMGPHVASLEVGTPQDPIPQGVTATIRLVAAADQDPDCAPGIVSAAARMEFHGAPMDRTWAKLAATAPAGSSTVVFDDPVDWQVGDLVIVSATDMSANEVGDPRGSFADGDIPGPYTEERTITAVNGASVTLDAPLTYEHIGGAPGELRGEVGNLSRNVKVVSKDPAGVRGHTMYHHGSQGGISYAEFQGLGKEQTLGRYPVHFHLAQETMRGASVIGASVWDSDNRWITIHGTHFLAIRDTVTYKGLGHGIFFEDASEVYNLVDDHFGALAMITDPIEGQVLEYDANAGGCYWAANARNFTFDSVFVECDGSDSYILDYARDDEPMPVYTLQPDGTWGTLNANEMSGGLVRGLEVHSHHGWGPWIVGGNFPADAPLVFENLRVWDIHYSIDANGDNIKFDDVEVHDTPYGFYNNFPGSTYVRNARMYDAGGFGAFMHYRGGGGTMLYEDLVIDDARIGFRITARDEQGADGEPIIAHARNYTFTNPPSSAQYVGSENMNARPDPVIMLVLHDFFGANDDAVVLPATQSPTLPEVPAGLSFVNGSAVPADQYDYAFPDNVQVAHGDVAWPDHPMTDLTDQLAPATVITSPRPDEIVRHEGGSLTVRGVVLDQFDVASVVVSGKDATIAPNGFDWSVTFNNVPTGGIDISAVATDSAGNEEALPHDIRVWVIDP